MTSDTSNKMRYCKIAEMPDNDKLSMASSISTVNNILGVSNKNEMNTSEDLLTNSFSDSESGTAIYTANSDSQIPDIV